jgi:phosphonate transport system substrate-binding protein
MNSSSKNYLYRFLGLILFFVFLFAGCSAIRQETPTVTPEATLTPIPTITPTPEVLGLPKNPVVIGFVTSNQDPNILSNAGEMANRLETNTGISIDSKIFSSYRELLGQMVVGRVHMAWLNPLTYLYASKNNFAQAVLLTNHFGTFQYGTQFLANISSGFISFYNPNVNQVTTDATNALQQFQGKRPCWVDATSLSGYIVPKGILAQNGIAIQEGVITQSHTSVVRSLYVAGVCDFGVTYATFGDPRTSSSVLQDLPDVMQRVIVIWQTDPIIPNLNLSFYPSVPEQLKEHIIIDLLLQIQTTEGRQILSQSLNYEIEDLKIVDDTVYDTLRDLVTLSGVQLEDLIGK